MNVHCTSRFFLTDSEVFFLNQTRIPTNDRIHDPDIKKLSARIEPIETKKNPKLDVYNGIFINIL